MESRYLHPVTIGPRFFNPPPLGGPTTEMLLLPVQRPRAVSIDRDVADRRDATPAPAASEPRTLDTTAQ